MADVSEGLTVDGEPLPAGDLTEAGFHAAVAAQVGKPREEIEAGGPHDAEADTADSIRGSLLGSEGSTSVADGLTVAEGRDKYGHTAAERRDIRARYRQLDESGAFDDGRRAASEEQARRTEGERAIEQLAAASFFNTWNDPYATDTQRIAAANELRQKAPHAYTRAIQALDEEALIEADEWGDDIPDEELPGYSLSVAVERATAEAQLERVQRQEAQLREHIAAERARVVREHYASRGVGDDQLEEAYVIDRDTLAALDIDLTQLDGKTTREVLERLRATQEAYAMEDRHNAIRAQIAGADLPLVEQGLEVLGVGGYMPLQPQPHPVAHRTVEELKGRIESKLRANTTRSEPVRRSDFHRAVLESESSHWHDGLTAGGLTGRRALELADGSRERYEREQQEARAQALSSAG